MGTIFCIGIVIGTGVDISIGIIIGLITRISIGIILILPVLVPVLVLISVTSVEGDTFSGRAIDTVHWIF